MSVAEDRVRDLEAEREHLTTLTTALENEVQSYREVVSTYESGGKYGPLSCDFDLSLVIPAFCLYCEVIHKRQYKQPVHQLFFSLNIY